MAEILILADDLSRAADCAVAWARAGAEIVALLEPTGTPGEARVAALDLNSRALPPGRAGAAAADALRRHSGPGPGLLYHKMDSTLRGNWVPELRAVRSAAVADTGAAPLAVVGEERR